jgi:aminotransferase
MEDGVMNKKTSDRSNSIEYSGIRKMVALAKGMKDIISFALGEPDFSTPRNIRKAACEALEKGYTHYTMTSGLPELNEAVAEKLEKENGLKYDPESEIVITVGACEACYASIMSTVNPGDEIIVTDPSFVFFAPTIVLAGGKPVFVPIKEENNFRPDMKKLESLISPKTRMIWINSPNNPTGAILLTDDMKEISRMAKENDLLVLADEVYEKFIYDGYKHYSIGAFPGMRERTITVNAFSKTYAMTGWRVGYVAADAELIERIHLVHMHMCTHPTVFAQKAAVEALQGPQDSVHEMVNEFRKRRDFIVSHLNAIDGISCWKSRGAIYAFPNISELGKSSWDLSVYLLKKAKINTVFGSAFGKEGEGHLRISFAASMSNIEEGMNRLEKAAKRLAG